MSPKAQFLALLNSHFSLYDLLYSLGFNHRPFIVMICSYKYMPLSLLSILNARIVSNSSWSCTSISDSRCVTLTVGLPPQAVFPKLHNDITTLWSSCSKFQSHATLLPLIISKSLSSLILPFSHSHHQALILLTLTTNSYLMPNCSFSISPFLLPAAFVTFSKYE